MAPASSLAANPFLAFGPGRARLEALRGAPSPFMTSGPLAVAALRRAENPLPGTRYAAASAELAAFVGSNPEGHEIRAYGANPPAVYALRGGRSELAAAAGATYAPDLAETAERGGPRR